VKNFLFSSILFLTSVTAFACPFCGCGNNNFQVGVLPTFSKAFVGVRYSYAQYNSLSADGTQFSNDYFHMAELWGGYQLKRVQLMAFVPYLSLHKTSDDGVADSKGMGDVLLLANYKIVSGKRLGSAKQTLWVGGGIKFKTGKYQVDPSDPAFTTGDFNSQVGTGSTDFLINATHNLLWNSHGVVTNAAYRINTANDQQFRFGNRVYINAAYFRSWPIKLTTIRPMLGLNFSANENNHFEGVVVSGSNGYVLSGVLGINVQRNNVGLLLNGFLPISQNLYEHQTHFQSRASAAITYSF